MYNCTSANGKGKGDRAFLRNRHAPLLQMVWMLACVCGISINFSIEGSGSEKTEVDSYIPRLPVGDCTDIPVIVSPPGDTDIFSGNGV
jgi:hypothetical protein